MVLLEMMPTICIGLSCVLIIKLIIAQSISDMTERRGLIGRSICYIMLLISIFELVHFMAVGAIVLIVLAIIVTLSMVPVFKHAENYRFRHFLI